MWYQLLLLCVGLICSAILIASLIRLWTKLMCVKFQSDVKLDKTTVVITGANSGIGKETALYMAKRGARVIMACRNISTAKVVRDEIAAESENSKIILHHVDLSSLQSVREFCAKIIETETKVDILIHNAGYYGGAFGMVVGVNGIEYTMAANYYGPFLMTYLLMDLLRKSFPSRIVMLGSKIHVFSFLNPNVKMHLNPINYWSPFPLYCNSKLAGLLFTFELARRLKGTGITVNALHPGSIDTGIFRNYSFPLNIPWRILRLFFKTLSEGIQTTLYVSLSRSLDNVSGEYFRNCRPAKAHKNAYNEEWQKIMWEESKRIVGVRSDDPVI